MKYSSEVEINLPVARVVELFDNPENLRQWQPALVEFEPISGNPGERGSKSRVHYKVGKRDIEFVETIGEKNLPWQQCDYYESKGMHGRIESKFVPIGNGRTKFISQGELKGHGLQKLSGYFTQLSFKKVLDNNLLNFKKFAESKNIRLEIGDE